MNMMKLPICAHSHSKDHINMVNATMKNTIFRDLNQLDVLANRVVWRSNRVQPELFVVFLCFVCFDFGLR